MSEIDPTLSRLYREASSEGPPAALDAAILAAARKQVAKPWRPARSTWVRWMAPASALATLVVAVSLAFLVEREQPATIDDTAVRRIPPRPQAPPPAPVPDAAKPMAADRAAPAAAAKKEAPAAAAPVPATAARLPAQTPELAAPAPAPPAPAQAPVPRPAAPAPPTAEAFPAERRAKAAESGMSAPKAAESKSSRESNVARDSALGGAAAGAPAAPAAAGKLAPLRQQSIQRSPEAWLDDISRLMREGRDKEAAEQLAEFRKAYPAHAVPEHLLK